MAKSCPLCINQKAPRRYSLMAQPKKHPKSGIYYLRRKVPEDLRNIIGRTEYKVSLNTRDFADAIAIYGTELAKSEKMFALARKQLEGQQTINLEEAQQLALEWYLAERDRLERTKAFTNMLASVGSTGREARDGYEEHERFATLQEGIHELEDLEWPDVVQPHLQEALLRQRIPMPAKGSTEYDWLFNAFSTRLQQLSEWALARHEGGWPTEVIAPPAPISSTSSTASLQRDERRKGQKLGNLFQMYSKQRRLTDGESRSTARTLDAYEVVVQRFTELHGDPDIQDIDRQMIAQHRSLLAQMPAKGTGLRGLSGPLLIEHAKKHGLPTLSEPTIKNRLLAISAVLTHGVRQGLLSENPVIASGLAKDAAKAATRRQATNRKPKGYSEEELALIFSSPVFSQEGWSPPRANFGKAWYWVPVLLYYTGARREEIAQLLGSDVRRSDEGQWYLNILETGDDDDGRRTVKTSSSQRAIPLHPDLIARGFLSYVKTVEPQSQLFPLLKASPNGYFGTNFGKRWGIYLREVVGLSSSASPAHGFRHAFKTLCRDVGMPEDVSDSITGHTGTNVVSRGYGSMPLRRMAMELEKLPTIGAILQKAICERPLPQEAQPGF